MPRRQLATYLLGLTAHACPTNLDMLRTRAAPDPSWEVQKVLAQEFDVYRTAVGDDADWPSIDTWLADPRPNVRRAVSDGPRQWTSKSRPYFARHPEQAVPRLAAPRLAAPRRDPSAYVPHSAGDALHGIRHKHAALVDAETAI